MSRFGEARWQRLAVWSGAALAWGSTLTAVVLEAPRAEADGASSPAPAASTGSVSPGMPSQPADGLLVIRYQQGEEPAEEPTTITVSQPAPAAPAAAAPQPTSSGS